ncbi:MAG: hypothetical protein VXX46_02495 [Bacteroidota bacterium]|nr:hypothetical protein [Bacteroidota bacterium]
MSAVREKLSQFIRRYHKIQAYQGLLLSLLETTILFYIINYTEYFLWLNTRMRGFMFYGWLVVVLALFIYQVGLPLVRMYGLASSQLSEERAAKIIGSHFNEVGDKLLNYLQLEGVAKVGSEANPLLIKSIEQKTAMLKPFTFFDALNLRKFKKQMLRFTTLIVLFGLWGAYDSENINASTRRILDYKNQFIKPAPFDFVFEHNEDWFELNQPVNVKVVLVGDEIPEQVFVNINGSNRLMNSNTGGSFRYTFNPTSVNTKLQFEAAGYLSSEYQLNMRRSISVEGITIKAQYPEYLNQKPRTIPYSKNIIIPFGTKLNWELKIKHAKKVDFNGNYSTLENPRLNTFHWNQQFFESEFVNCYIYGKEHSRDSFSQQINIIPDLEPRIKAEAIRDSSQENIYYIAGEASDDHFVNRVFLEWRKTEKEAVKKIRFDEKPREVVTFLQAINLKDWGLETGEKVQFRIGAIDNNGIIGGAVAYTDWKELRRWTKDEYEDNLENSKEALSRSINESRQTAKDLKRQSEKLKNQFLQQRGMDFDLQLKVQNWLEQQNKQLDKFEKAIEQQKAIEKQNKELETDNQELLERREELQERMERAKDPRLEALMKELRELLEKQSSKQEIQQKMDQIDRRMQNQQEDLSSIEEQLKELRMEENIDRQLQDMSDWIEKQQQLQEDSKTAINESQREQLIEKLQDQAEKALDIKKRSGKIRKQNEELKNPMSLKTGEQKAMKAASNTEEARKAMQQGETLESLGNQKSAEQQMHEAMEGLQESLEKSKSERNAEDLQALRALLENLIEVSHTQEKTFTELSSLDSENPRIKDLNKRQVNIKNMSASIEDSLRALATRQPMISDMVNREINDVNENMNNAFNELKVRNVRKASMYEQYVMTGYNNLAVMLMESLKNVQQKMQQSSQSKGGKQCNTPKQQGNSGKSSKGKGSKLSEQQKKLGEKLQQMQMNQGKQAGKEKGGKSNQQKGEGKNTKGKQGKNKGEKGESQRLSDKELVEMILSQEELRRKISELRKEALKDGETGMAANLFEAEKLMDEQEKEWAQKVLTNKSLWRQKEILTRLLQHEKAERKQEQDDQRESGKSEGFQIEFPPELLKWKQEQKQEKERLRRVPPNFDPYYQQKSKAYLNR